MSCSHRKYQITTICSVLLLIVINRSECYKVKDAPLLTKRPPWLIPCRRSDPQISECLRESFAAMFPQLAVGIPEMNVDPFEPLPLDEVSVSKGSGAITLAGGLFDLQVAGSSNSSPTYSEFDLLQNKWNFGLDIPLLDIKARYNLKGKILVLPLVGHGACDLRLSGVETNVTADIEFPKRDGREIMRIVKMNVYFEVGGLRVKLHNLFNGNKVLGLTVNNFINQNAIDVMNDLQENIGMSLAVIFTDILNNIYSKMPTDLWLLTDEQWADYRKEKTGVAEAKKL